MLSGDPYTVGPGYLAAMHAAELAEFHKAGWGSLGAPRQVRPAGLAFQPVPRQHQATLQRLYLADVIDPPDVNTLGLRSDLEGADDGGRGGIGKWPGRGFHYGKTLPAQLVQEHVAHEAAVVDIEPFGGGDERPEIAGFGLQHGGQKEVDMQPRKLAGFVPEAASFRGQPALPFGRQQVMPNVWRIAHVKRPSLRQGQLHVAVVGKQNPRSVLKSGRRQIATGDQRGHWVDVDANQLGFGKLAAGGEEKSCGTHAGVDDALRLASGAGLGRRRPIHHSFDNRERGIRSALFATLRRRPQNREGVAERIAFPGNVALQIPCRAVRQAASPADQRLLRRREIGNPEGTERDSGGQDLTLGFQAEAGFGGLDQGILE